MKKFFVSLAVVCMISLLAVSAFAYEAVDGKNWVKSIKADTEAKKVTITFGEDYLKTYAPNGGRVAVFSEKPELVKEGDAGFWVIYKGSEGNDQTGKGILVTGNNAVSGETFDLDASALEEGKTYYLTLVGCNLNDPNNWTWTTEVFEFKYSTESKPTADFSVIAYAVAAITGCGALVVAKKRG